MAVRSKRLAGPTEVGSASALLYTCPTGVTAIVKTVAIFNQAIASQGVGLFHGVANAAHRILGTNVAGGQSLIIVELFIVLEPGEVIRAQSQTSNCTYTLYGAELSGVAP